MGIFDKIDEIIKETKNNTDEIHKVAESVIKNICGDDIDHHEYEFYYEVALATLYFCPNMISLAGANYFKFYKKMLEILDAYEDPEDWTMVKIYEAIYDKYGVLEGAKMSLDKLKLMINNAIVSNIDVENLKNAFENLKNDLYNTDFEDIKNKVLYSAPAYAVDLSLRLLKFKMEQVPVPVTKISKI